MTIRQPRPLQVEAGPVMCITARASGEATTAAVENLVAGRAEPVPQPRLPRQRAVQSRAAPAVGADSDRGKERSGPVTTYEILLLLDPDR